MPSYFTVLITVPRARTYHTGSSIIHHTYRTGSSMQTCCLEPLLDMVSLVCLPVMLGGFKRPTLDMTEAS